MAQYYRSNHLNTSQPLMVPYISTFKESTLFRHVGAFSRQVDKGAPNLFNNKEML